MLALFPLCEFLPVLNEVLTFQVDRNYEYRTNGNGRIGGWRYYDPSRVWYFRSFSVWCFGSMSTLVLRKIGHDKESCGFKLCF